MSNNYVLPSVSALSFVLVSAANSVFAQDDMLTPVEPLDFAGTIQLSGESFVSNPEAPPFACEKQDLSLLTEEERLNQMFNSVVVVLPMSEKGIGAGFIIDQEQGYIITNNHVVNTEEGFVVHLYDKSMPNDVGRRLNVDIVGSDEDTDIAVLKVDPKNLQSCAQIASDTVSYSDTVTGIGHPFFKTFSLTKGVVSSPRRYLDEYPFIQSDASINPGNSGGPLFNEEGYVVGVNSGLVAPKKYGSSGISVTIPIDRALNVAEDIILFGEKRNPWLGIHLRDVTYDERDELGLVNGAVYTDKVDPHGPLALAGIVESDIILRVNEIDTTNILVTFNAVQFGDPGDVFEVTYLREGQEFTTYATSEAHEDYLARMDEIKSHKVQQASTGGRVRDYTLGD